jgi:hypothetical protein
MRSDFINKRFIYSRRRADGGGGGGEETEEFYEFHFLPEFDTFIWFDSANGNGNDRWNVELGNGSDSGRTILPISPLNPWNDATDNPDANGGGGGAGPGGGGQGAVLSAPRTPARAVLGYKVTGLPEDATVVGAELRLTVNSKKNWD